MKSLLSFLHTYGFDSEQSTLIATLVAAALAIFLIFIVEVLIRRILLRWVDHFAAKTSTKIDDLFVSHNVFSGFSRLVPPILIHLLSFPVFQYYPEAVLLVKDFALLYFILGVVLVSFSFFDAFAEYLNGHPIAPRLPINSFVQVLKFLTVFVGLILVLSKLLGQSPVVFLSGLGAFTAVLLLIFKDSILGLVAGIRLTSNNLAQIGDWIEMPKYNADGEIIDISLVTVSVQNWDKSISTIPAYALISEGFKNWRGMRESGGRRIKQSVIIDMTSIKFCDDVLLSRLLEIQLLRGYLDAKTKEVKDYNSGDNIDDSSLVNGRRLTNFGTFRAYLSEYLHHHPKVNASMTLIIRYLQPTANGIPLELHVFSSEKDSLPYEQVKADIMDHILAVLPNFELRVFQNPCGSVITQADKNLAASLPHISNAPQ